MGNDHRTACQANPELWFSEDRNDQSIAKAACMRCPIQPRCRELGWEQEHGVWGGLSEVDRKRLDPVRYAAAQERSKLESAEFDVVVAGVIERVRQQRLLEEE